MGPQAWSGGGSGCPPLRAPALIRNDSLPVTTFSYHQLMATDPRLYLVKPGAPWTADGRVARADTAVVEFVWLAEGAR